MTLAASKPRDSRIFEREENDHYAEPLWVSERLFDVLDLPAKTKVLDPACGFGRIVRAANSRDLWAFGTDIVPRWENQPDGAYEYADVSFALANFFADVPATLPTFDVIASNPPFKHAQRFAELALKRANSLVALLLPTKWVQGNARSRWLETTPLKIVMPIAPRPSMPPGQVWLEGGPVGGGTVDFSWFIWERGYGGPPMIQWLRRDA